MATERKDGSSARGISDARTVASMAEPGPPGLDRTLAAVARLRATVAGAAEQVAAFQNAVDTRLDLLSAYAVSAYEMVGSLERRVADAQEEARQASVELAAAYDQTARLTCLYVATLELHATLEPAAVRVAIAAILENLLGVEGYSLLVWNAESNALEVVHARGLAPSDPLARGSYRGGDAVVDAALADGAIRMGPFEDSPALVVVPLRVMDTSVGLLVIVKLLAHKPSIDERDREMLELLASHAATGLYLAELHASADRKLRTLENLVKLVRPK